jgi:hypothetical protein
MQVWGINPKPYEPKGRQIVRYVPASEYNKLRMELSNVVSQLTCCRRRIAEQDAADIAKLSRNGKRWVKKGAGK